MFYAWRSEVEPMVMRQDYGTFYYKHFILKLFIVNFLLWIFIVVVIGDYFSIMSTPVRFPI